MSEYWNIFKNSFGDYGSYVWREITFQVEPWYQNYFWLLILLSLTVWGLEILFPWRKNQSIIRKDFWLDTFYMFFNFYVFRLIIFMAVSNITDYAFLNSTGINNEHFGLLNLYEFNPVLQLIILFLSIDLIKYSVHILLHRIDFLWQFHKVHHSVEEMGFAAHLRFHWMEIIIYRPFVYLTVLFIGGFNVENAFIVHFIFIAVGHISHANLNWDYGIFKYVLNNPKMHLWHHAEKLPEKHSYGVNFGISLSIWDYIFRTAYVPKKIDGSLRLGFNNLNIFPKTFLKQIIYPFKK